MIILKRKSFSKKKEKLTKKDIAALGLAGVGGASLGAGAERLGEASGYKDVVLGNARKTIKKHIRENKKDYKEFEGNIKELKKLSKNKKLTPEDRKEISEFISRGRSSQKEIKESTSAFKKILHKYEKKANNLPFVKKNRKAGLILLGTGAAALGASTALQRKKKPEKKEE